MSKLVIDDLKKRPLQGYLTDSVQLHDVLAQLLEQTGAVHLIVTTFSASEEFLRRLIFLRDKGLLQRITLFIDVKASAKQVKLANMLLQVGDEVYYCQNHSKLLLLANDTWSVSVCTSQNQTRGNRHECGLISTDKSVYDSFYLGIQQLIELSYGI